MKIKGIHKLLLLIGIMAIVSFATVVMRDPIFMDSHEITYPDVFLSSYAETGSYKFNSTTIFQSLDRGDVDVFLPSSTPGTQPIPSFWKQADYLRLVNALHQFVWKQALEDWTFNNVNFYGDCGSDSIKLDVINITYHKTAPLLQYTAHMIVIYPLSGEIAWGGGGKYPRSIFEKWKGIDLQRLKIPFDEAMQIAEDSGGRSTRISMNNGCRISIAFSSNDQNWHVRYSDKSTRPIFEMLIDGYTGKHELMGKAQ